MMPINNSIAHLELVGTRIMLREPGSEQPVPMPDGAVEEMCARLDAQGDHDEAARHRRELHVLRSLAQRMADAPGASGAERS
jgi:hypothetical protein